MKICNSFVGKKNSSKNKKKVVLGFSITNIRGHLILLLKHIIFLVAPDRPRDINRNSIMFARKESNKPNKQKYNVLAKYMLNTFLINSTSIKGTSCHDQFNYSEARIHKSKQEIMDTIRQAEADRVYEDFEPSHKWDDGRFTVLLPGIHFQVLKRKILEIFIVIY